MSPSEIRDRNLLPNGLLPLPHVKQATGGQVFPEEEIREIGRQEGRDLRRFDVDFDLPDLTPESRHRIPDHPSGTGRRVPRRVADDPQLL